MPICPPNLRHPFLTGCGSGKRIEKIYKKIGRRKGSEEENKKKWEREREEGARHRILFIKKGGMGEGEGVRARIKKIWERERESEIEEDKQKLYGRGGGRVREKEIFFKKIERGTYNSQHPNTILGNF